MGNKKKMVFNVLFLVLIFAGTIYGVFHGEDIGQISDILQTVNPWWLIPGVVCVVVFIWGESIIIHYMMRNLGVKVGRGTCFLFSSVGFFFSCITPSASGGQPAQIYYMKKKKIPIPVSTQVLLIVTITYKLVLVLLGLGIAIFGQKFIHTYIDDVQWVFYLGLVLNVVCVAGMVLFAFHPSLAKAFVVKGSRLLEKMRFLRHKKSREEKLAASMEKYNQTADYMMGHFGMLVVVFIITVVQRFSLFAATWFVYKAFGLVGTSAGLIILMQGAIAVAVDMLPLPGGMGISEKLFMEMFLPIFGSKLLLPGMILSRGLGYYTELIISAVFTIVANFVIGRKTDETKIRDEHGSL